MDSERIRGITLRVAVFFGLTTFTLCIGVFYIESILDETRDTLIQKDSAINVLEQDIILQQQQVKQTEMELLELKGQLESLSEDSDNATESE